MTKPGRVRILQKGQQATVYALETVAGDSPAHDFLGGLDVNGQTGFKSRLEVLASQGYLRSPEYMRELSTSGRPKVFEIKVDKGPGYRLYVIRHHRNWVATHGGTKPKKRSVAVEADLARRLFEEWKQ